QTLDKNDVKILTESVFEFFRSNKPFESFQLKSGIDYFNENEISHLNDVRILLNRIMLAFYISAGLFIIVLIFLADKKYLFFLRNIAVIFVISTSAMLFFLISLYILGNNFSGLFKNFHLVFFPQGNWAFPEDALIINIFPFGFFYDFFFRLLSSSFFVSLFLLAFSVPVLVISNKLISKKISCQKE
ncbi:MAG: DUF1461 domain-containing protein, partial [Actinobacteria bacterium]|nr:DUF1461 domain-containing protein [Actinomycetota bacterium]